MGSAPPPNFPGGAVVKNSPAKAGDKRDMGSIPGLERSLREGNGILLLFLPAESHGPGSLAGYSPRGHKESDTTEPLSTRHSTLVVTELVLCAPIGHALWK